MLPSKCVRPCGRSRSTSIGSFGAAVRAFVLLVKRLRGAVEATVTSIACVTGGERYAKRRIPQLVSRYREYLGLPIVSMLYKIVRILYIGALSFLSGCVNLSTICPHKPITQGVFGEIVNSSNALEQNVEVDIFTTVNGMQGAMIASAQTTRGGYQFNVGAAPYILCAKMSARWSPSRPASSSSPRWTLPPD